MAGGKTSSFFVCSIYRPPSRSNQIEDVSKMSSFLTDNIRKLPKNSEVFITGDINCDLSKSSTLSAIVKEFLQRHSLRSCINKPTRVTP